MNNIRLFVPNYNIMSKYWRIEILYNEKVYVHLDPTEWLELGFKVSEPLQDKEITNELDLILYNDVIV